MVQTLSRKIKQFSKLYKINLTHSNNFWMLLQVLKIILLEDQWSHKSIFRIKSILWRKELHNNHGCSKLNLHRWSQLLQHLTVEDKWLLHKCTTKLSNWIIKLIKASVHHTEEDLLRIDRNIPQDRPSHLKTVDKV